jgi:GNAT superfamily N-acetyltransferase
VIGSTPTARLAGRSDVDGVAGVLARSFFDDPVMRWMFPEHGKRLRHNERFFAMRVRGLLDQEAVYTTDGHRGAAVWALPERWRMPPFEALAAGFRLLTMVGRRAPTLARGWDVVEKAHPREPHYYLAILGTEPELQGRGIGSALMAPVLDGCDRDEIPAYLESSREENIAFYARHGFRVTGEVDLPGGPRVWPMWRDPAV